MALTNIPGLDNIELSEALATGLSIGGTLLGFFAPMAGSVILTGITMLVSVVISFIAQDLNQMIDAERIQRNKATAGPTEVISSISTAVVAAVVAENVAEAISGNMPFITKRSTVQQA